MSKSYAPLFVILCACAIALSAPRAGAQSFNRNLANYKPVLPFGTHHFAIPFDASGKKWVRFAVWDTAGNGAFTQPIALK